MPTAPPTFAPAYPRGKTFGYNHTSRQDQTVTVGAKDIRNTARWRKVRQMILARTPLCADPYGQHGVRPVLAQQVDHILSLRERPDLALTLSNLQGLCTRCHARKSQGERQNAS